MNDLRKIKTKLFLIIFVYLLFYILSVSVFFLTTDNVDASIDIDHRYMLRSLAPHIYLVDKAASDILAINGNISEFQLYNDVIVGNINNKETINFDKKLAPAGYFILDKKSGKAILRLSKDKFMKILSENYNINEMPEFEDGIKNYHKYFGLKSKDQK